MDQAEALRQWNSAAAGWAKWEPVHNHSLAAATVAMLERAGVTAGSRVIDIACGAGDQTLAAARRVGPDGSVLATDIAAAMLDYVTAAARLSGLGNIETLACGAQDLPRDRGGFDAAICRLCLMLLADPDAAMAAVYGVLRPGGGFGAVVIGPPAANPFYAGAIATLRRHAGKPAPAAGPGLYALADTTVLRALFARAGFVEIEVTTVESSLRVASAEEGRALIQEAAGAVRAIIGDQPEAVQAAAWAEVLEGLRRFETPEGLVAPAQYHVIGGRKPA